MRRLCTAVFLLGLLVAPAGAAQADEEYPPPAPTACHVGVPQVTVGERVVLRIEVSSNGNVPEVGSVDLTISTAPAAGAARATARLAAEGVVWSRTVRYEGTPLEVTGPRLPRGRYTVDMTFTSDEGGLLGCHNAAAFRVGRGGETGGEDDGGGALPNTGGPQLWPLLVGLGLVLVGGGLAAGGRRSHRAALS